VTTLVDHAQFAAAPTRMGSARLIGGPMTDAAT